MHETIPVVKRVAVSLWRLAAGDSYRSTALTFGTFCAIDGSHIEIKAPLECKEDFLTEKNTTALSYRELLMQT